MGNLTYIGIDVGKRQLSCSLPGRKVVDFSNDRQGIQSLLKLAPSLAVPLAQLCFVMESTGGYSAFTAETLLELADVKVSIVPPACVIGFKKSYISRTKTDRSDAAAIRRFAESRHPAPWFPPGPGERRLRDLQLLMDGIRNTIARQKCLREKLQSACQPDEFALGSIQRQLDAQQAEYDLLNAEFEAVIAADLTLAEDSANMLSIPHVGPVLRTTIMVFCYQQLKQLSQRKLLAFCGLCPQENQSGQFKGHTTVSKAGDGRIRKMLYMAALGAVRSDGLMYDYFQRQKAKGKHGKTILVGVMRKLLYIIQGVVKSKTRFSEEKFLASV
jgi:transposase